MTLFPNVLTIACVTILAGTSSSAELTGELQAHDPSTILKENGRYRVFTTGPGISTKSSTNGQHWIRGKPVFPAPPAWTTNVVPGFRGHFWAPDVIEHGGKYFLYYSVSTFGKQRSAIGLATSPSLTEPAWTDQGPVLVSSPGDPYNAIDPSLLLDRDGKLWMAFGSFWRGIYLLELDPATGKRISTNSPAIHLAYHEAIEAAGLHRRGDNYYLFVNWGICCRGTNSTYEVQVGRSRKVTGPYLDRDGKNLASGGGTLFLATQGSDIGPGHVEVLEFNGQEYVSYHVYDAKSAGRPRLRLAPVRWTEDGWPEVDARAGE